MAKDPRSTRPRSTGTDTPPPPDAASIETADALRQALDHGGAADKVNFQDPAAAPLGTDDEAAGHPPTREQVRMAAASELGPRYDPPDERRTIPKLIDHPVGPALMIAAFGLAMILMFLD